VAKRIWFSKVCCCWILLLLMKNAEVAAEFVRGEERRSFAESDRQGFIEPEGRGRGMMLSLARRA